MTRKEEMVLVLRSSIPKSLPNVKKCEVFYSSSPSNFLQMSESLRKILESHLHVPTHTRSTCCHPVLAGNDWLQVHEQHARSSAPHFQNIPEVYPLGPTGLLTFFSLL